MDRGLTVIRISAKCALDAKLPLIVGMYLLFDWPLVAGELAAFLVELMMEKKLVQPKQTGDSSAASLLYDFLHS